MHNSHVLVTGGAGFIGSFVVDHFSAQGFKVRVLDSLDPQVHPQGRPAYLNPNAELVTGDVRDRDLVARVTEGCDIIVHCAAAVGVGQSLYEIERYVDVNVRGTATLLDVLVAKRPTLRKLVVLTSMTGYGEGVYERPSDGRRVRPRIRTEADIERYGWEPVDPLTGEPLRYAPTPESAELLASNVYALTKRYQEELTLSVARLYGFPAVCFRMFNVFGPRQSLNNPYTGVLAIFLSRLLAGEQPVIYEDGLQSRDFVSVHDVVHAIDLAIRRDDVHDVVMNLGSGVSRRIIDCAEHLANELGITLDVHPSGRFRAGDIRHCIADISRAAELLGFEPRVTWEGAVAELIEWSRTAERSGMDFQRAERELQLHGLVR